MYKKSYSKIMQARCPLGSLFNFDCLLCLRRKWEWLVGFCLRILGCAMVGTETAVWVCILDPGHKGL